MMICLSPRAAEVGHGPESAADETLDLLGPARDAAGDPLARRPLLGRPGEHGVLGGDPSPAGASKERRHALLDRGRGQDPRQAHLDQGRSVGKIERVDGDLVGTKLVRRTLAGTDGIHYLIQMAGVWSFFVWARKSSKSFLAWAESVSALRSLSYVSLIWIWTISRDFRLSRP